MLQSTSELRDVKLCLVNIQPCLVSAFQLLVSGHCTLVRESIPIAAVESVSTSMWISLSTRPVDSPLMRNITQVQDCEQLTLRCIQSCHAGACTELAWSAVPASFVDLQSIGIFGSHFDFFLDAFHFSTQALSRLRQLLLVRFFKILAVLDVGVCACTLFSGHRRLQQAVLDLPSTRLLAFCCPPSDPSRTVLLPSTSNHDQLSQYLIQTIHFLGLMIGCSTLGAIPMINSAPLFINANPLL